VILFAFNPLAVPLVVDTLGVNMLWRFTWLLPVPFVIPAYAAAFRGNGVEIPSGAVFVILIVAAMQLPTLQASYTTYEKGRSAWRATAALEQVYDVLSAEAQRHDVALATGIPSLQLPAHVPKVSQLAYRGPLGTRWHFPRERVDEGVARELAVQAFYTNIGRDFNQSDYDTLTDYDVAYIILAVDDPRFSQVSDIRGLELLFSNLEWALVSVDVDSLKWFEFI
ncbi:MAG: hypothetical protein KJO18_06875, partial [Acidimicrobiia bacterium]|nr:hypothetical protein [Acidimicrobiia bacterium]